MADSNDVLLSGRNLSKVFGFGRNKVMAVKDAGFDFHSREIITIVGESGSGKTTLAKMILGLLRPTGGTIEYLGKPIKLSTLKSRREYWQNVQGVFQDPFSSFNQFRNVGQVLTDCIRLKDPKAPVDEKDRCMREACGFVNLDFDEIYNKFPFELSGGQMQRLMIARIFLIHPAILIADEPTSMIDACSRSIILDMLLALREKNDMMIVFITHDIGLAYYVSDTIFIMQAGEIKERGPADEIIQRPHDEYTRRLLNDVPKIHEPWIV